MKKYSSLSKSDKLLALQLFNEMLQNEQLKANQAVSAFSSGNDFGGTSVTSLIRVPELARHLSPMNYDDLAESIAEVYVSESKKFDGKLEKAFTNEEVNLFERHGLFYGVHISPKLLGITEGLTVQHKDLLLAGFPDPYALPKGEECTRRAYFEKLKKERGMDLNLRSLVLADSTTPKGFEGKKILNPVNLNEKLSRLSELTTKAVCNKGISVDSLYIISTDTDSPQRLAICEGRKALEGYPLTPGLTLCGSTSTMEQFDFMYLYRMGLISQALSNNIVSSKMNGRFTPFVFFGMLSPFGYKNGAIAPGEMGKLRYLGDIDLNREFNFQYEINICKLMEN